MLRSPTSSAFPVDEIKIDRNFVRDLEEDPDDAAIVSAVIGLGRNLGLKIVAKGSRRPARPKSSSPGVAITVRATSTRSRWPAAAYHGRSALGSSTPPIRPASGQKKPAEERALEDLRLSAARCTASEMASEPHSAEDGTASSAA